MKVYVVKTVYDTEYGGYDIDFITTDENKAKEYCDENNYKWEHWSGKVYDNTYYDEYEVDEEQKGVNNGI